jgi:hypothetical protein
MGPIAGLDDVEKTKILPLQELEIQPLTISTALSRLPQKSMYACGKVPYCL